jgi:hypothetical protein
MIIKFRDRRKGEHVHSHIWMGPDEDHLALTGTLIMTTGEWQIFGVALILGAKTMNDHRPNTLKVLSPDQLEVVEGGQDESN